MLEIRSQKAGPTECRSFGSNQHQSSRSAKVSIGIIVEKSPTVISSVEKEDAHALQSAQIHSTSKGMVVGNQSLLHGESSLETTKEELNGAQKISEHSPSRSSCCKASNADASKFRVNQLPVLPSELANDQDRKKNGNVHVDQVLTFMSMRKTKSPDQENTEKQTIEPYKSTTDGLKIKLWEILGAPSQKEQSINSVKLDENNENFGVNSKQGLKKGGTARFNPSSDPIETDSDSPNQTVRRPATRSMTRKKCPNKIGKSLDDALNNSKRPLTSVCSDYKHKAKKNLKENTSEKIFFSLGREDVPRMQNQIAFAKSEADIGFEKINGSFSDNNPNAQTNFKCNDKDDIFSFAAVVGKKRSMKIEHAQLERLSEKKNPGFEKNKICLPSLSSSKNTRQKNVKAKSFPSAKVLQSMDEIKTSPFMYCPSKKQSMESKNSLNDSQNSQLNARSIADAPLVAEAVTYENAQSSLPKKEKRSWEHATTYSMPKFVSQRDKAACSPVTNSADVSGDLPSPTFAGKVTATTPSRSSNEIDASPLKSRKINFNWNFNNSDILDKDKPRSVRSEANIESSDDTREVYESQNLGSTFMDRNEGKEQLSLSPKARHDSDIFGAEVKFKEFRQTSTWFPSVDNSGESQLKLHKRKRVCGPKDARLSEEDGTDDFHDASEQCVKDSLARAVSQLALALRRMNSKIQLHTNKKSCEILSAVAEKIKQQLQYVDSKIQEDMGTFSGTSKSKRKHLESRFDEHQERLRLIHEKYKEELNHHLLNCSSALEELEAQNVELKVTADRQKVLHRKLLFQLEETMKDQLSAAETSITSIKEDARKRLNSLKFALNEWLSDGAVS